MAGHSVWGGDHAGSIPATRTNYPFRSMAGRCALNADTVVRFHQRVPIDQMTEWLGGALQKRACRFNSGSGLQFAPVARMDRHPPSKRTRRGFESCRERHGHVAQLDEHDGPNVGDAGSSPAVIANTES